MQDHAPAKRHLAGRRAAGRPEADVVADGDEEPEDVRERRTGGEEEHQVDDDQEHRIDEVSDEPFAEAGGLRPGAELFTLHHGVPAFHCRTGIGPIRFVMSIGKGSLVLHLVRPKNGGVRTGRE